MEMTLSPYQGVFLSLLPTGKAWNKRPDSTLARLAGGLSDEVERVNQDAAQMLRERFPSTSILLLDDWEQWLGLPDCTSESGTVRERQNAAANKMRMVGSLNRRFYEWLALQYGYHITLTDSDEGQFTTNVNIQTGVTWRNATVLDNCLTPLRVYDSGALECLLEKYKPAHQIYKYIYPDED
jgi:uncharacterized protein YmfQ (DUF2313 family)